MKTHPKCRRPLGVHGRFRCLFAVAAVCAPFAACSRGNSYPIRDAAVELPVETGSVNVTGGFDQCPTLLIQITPTLVRVGQTIMVDAQAASADGGALTFTWTSPSGTFKEPAAASTTFTCVTAGPATITLSVSDGVCATSQTAPATCVAVPDGGVSGGGGMSGSSGTGGAGGGGVPPNMCPAHEPLSGDPAACEACTAANCGLDPDPDGDAGCCALTNVADQLLCEAVVNCFQNPVGADPIPCTKNGDPTKCFCGTSAGACFMTAGAANGPCKAQVAAAAKTSIPTMIQAQFSDPISPLGRANNLLNCRGSFCKAACGII